MKNYLAENVWVWCGTLLVLLTLSGATLRTATFLTLATIALHSVVTYLKRGD